MENTKNEVISKKIIPSYWYTFYNITGVLHCRQGKDGLKFSLISSVISLILLFTLLYSLILQCILNYHTNLKDSMHSLIMIINISITFVGQAICTVMSVVSGATLKFNKVLTPIIKVEKLLISMGSAGKSDGHSYILIAFIYYMLIMGNASLFFILNKEPWISAVTFFVSKIYLYSVGLIFIELSKQLKSRFIRLNELIANYGNSEESVAASQTDIVNVTIQGIREAHFLLCEAIEQINSMFGVQLMVYFTSLFIETVIHPYFILQSVMKPTEITKSPSFFIFQLSLLSFSLIQLIFTTLNSNRTTYYAKETEFYVSSLLSPEMSSEARKEIKYALLQISSNTQEFTVLDLFTIDLTIITSFAGMAVTYLIIILQFQSASTGN